MYEIRTFFGGVVNDWRANGACRDHPPRWWFPDSEASTRGRPRRHDPATIDPDAARALAICATCPVLLDCRSWALAHEANGIWGGLTAGDRARERRRLHIRLNEPSADDDSWKRPRAAYLFRQGWTAGQIATELRTEVRNVHRWLTAEGLDAYPPPDGRAPRRRHEEQVRVRPPRPFKKRTA